MRFEGTTKEERIKWLYKQLDVRKQLYELCRINGNVVASDGNLLQTGLLLYNSEDVKLLANDLGYGGVVIDDYESKNFDCVLWFNFEGMKVFSYDLINIFLKVI